MTGRITRRKGRPLGPRPLHNVVSTDGLRCVACPDGHYHAGQCDRCGLKVTRTARFPRAIADLMRFGGTE